MDSYIRTNTFNHTFRARKVYTYQLPPELSVFWMETSSCPPSELSVVWMTLSSCSPSRIEGTPHTVCQQVLPVTAAPIVLAWRGFLIIEQPATGWKSLLDPPIPESDRNVPHSVLG